jgi:hypothetical protein
VKADALNEGRSASSLVSSASLGSFNCTLPAFLRPYTMPNNEVSGEKETKEQKVHHDGTRNVPEADDFAMVGV